MTSPAALAFLEDLLGSHAEEAPGGCRRVSLTQAELSRRSGRSAGTVAYYLTQAGPDVVIRRRNGIVVDLEQLEAARACVSHRRRRRDDIAGELARAWGTPVKGGSELELLTEDGRTPTLAAVAARVGIARSTAQRHLSELTAQGRLERRGGRLYLRSVEQRPRPLGRAHALADAIQEQAAPEESLQSPASTLTTHPPSLEQEMGECLVEIAARLSSLGERLLQEGDGSRRSARKPREVGAQTAETREEGRTVAGGFSLTSTEKDRNLSFSSPNRETLREGVRGRRSDREPEGPVAACSLTDDEIDDVLASLMAAARERGVSDMLDRQGHDYLRQIPIEGLARAAAHIEQLLRSGYPARKPMGILVKAAMTGDKAMFATPASRQLPSDRSSRLIDAARSHALTLAGITDLNDDDRRYMLSQHYGKDQAALNAALSVLDRGGAVDATPVTRPIAAAP